MRVSGMRRPSLVLVAIVALTAAVVIIRADGDDTATPSSPPMPSSSALTTSTTTLRQVADRECTTEASGVALWLADGGGGGAQVITGGISGLFSWSPDGRQLVFGKDRAVCISDVGVGKAVIQGVTYAEQPIASAGWSNDGHRVLFTTRRDAEAPAFTIEEVDRDGSGLHRLGSFQADGRILPAPSWFPDASRVLFSATPPNGAKGMVVWAMNADGSQPMPFCSTFTAAADQAGAWSRDGLHLAYASGDRIEICDSHGKREATVACGRFAYWSLAWGADDASIAFSGRRVRDAGPAVDEIYVTRWSASTQCVPHERRAGLPGDTDDLLAWSPDGTTLAFRTMPSALDASGTIAHRGLLHLVDAGGTGARAIADGSARQAAWSPNGKQLAFSGTTLSPRP
jgi:Tol biopolymer transport system component